MPDHETVLDRTMGSALSGRGSHVEVPNVVDGLDWQLGGTRLQGAPHTLFQLVNHTIYWQEWAARWLDGRKPKPPEHAAGS